VRITNFIELIYLHL